MLKTFPFGVEQANVNHNIKHSLSVRFALNFLYLTAYNKNPVPNPKQSFILICIAISRRFH